MRRMARICFVVGLICGALPVCAAQRDKQARQADSHRVKSVKKTVSLEGRVCLDGKTVVSDQDGEGRRVTIKAYTDSNSGEIHVTAVRLRVERASAKLDDAAFRR